MALSAEDRELITLLMQGNHARTEAQFNVIDGKLDNINQHLLRLNGSVLSHAKEIEAIKSMRDKKYQQLDDYMLNADEKHARSCPNQGVIRQLQDESLSNKSVKKFMFATFTGGIAIGGLIVGIIKLIIG